MPIINFVEKTEYFVFQIYFVQAKKDFSMAIGNGKLIQKCFPKQSRMGAAWKK